MRPHRASHAPQTAPGTPCDSTTRAAPGDRSSVGETIELIDRQIRQGFPWLRFGADLERRFVADNFASHRRFVVRVALAALVLYDLFLFNDLHMMPDAFVRACLARLAIFTPLALLAIHVVNRTSCAHVAEGAMCAMSVASLTLTLAVVLQSADPHRIGCIYGTLLVMMFTTIVHRLRFRYAAAAVGEMLVALCVAMSRLGMFHETLLEGNLTLFVPAALLLGAASYVLEREERLGYLVALRSHLLNQQIELSGSLDPLTDLWNRRALNAAMDRAWSGAAATPSAMAVILADVDRFKLFNDSYGHLAGDACLKRVAGSLRAALPDETHVLARFGGEEFVVFVPGLEEGAAVALAERLRQAVRSAGVPHPALGPGAVVTASFGVAVAGAPAIAAAALMDAADRALYAAKTGGRDCVRLAPPTMSQPGPLYGPEVPPCRWTGVDGDAGTTTSASL